MGLGWGRPGPRTTETKSEGSELWRPLKLCICTIIAGWALLGALTWIAWINKEKVGAYAFFYYHPRIYWTLYVGWAVLRIWALIGRWGRETSDEDYTSLQMANHPLRGILPLTATTRWLFVLIALGERYFWGRKVDPVPDDNDFFRDEEV